jgi:hypothetical protein
MDAILEYVTWENFLKFVFVILALIVGFDFATYKDEKTGMKSIFELMAGDSVGQSPAGEDEDPPIDMDPKDLVDDSKLKDHLSNEIKQTPDRLHGQTDKYEWTQNSSEIEMFFPVEETIKKQDIDFNISNKSIRLSIRGSTVTEGEFFADVNAAECNWQLGW